MESVVTESGMDTVQTLLAVWNDIWAAGQRRPIFVCYLKVLKRQGGGGGERHWREIRERRTFKMGQRSREPLAEREREALVARWG